VRYVRVETVSEILDGLQEDGARLLAGGTDLIVKMRSGLAAPTLLIDVSGVASLQGVVEADGVIEIGATTPEEDLLASPVLRDRLPLLTAVLRVLGSVQIRTRGTLGGNLVNASPAADSAVPLLLYDAEVVLVGRERQRVLPVERFLLGPGKTDLEPGEFVRAVRVPTPQEPFAPFFHKVGKRRALTIAIASVGGLIRLKGKRVLEARFAAGSVAPVPLRLRQVEEALRGAILGEETLRATAQLAKDSVSPISDVRASADYRRSVVGSLVARALRSALA